MGWIWLAVLVLAIVVETITDQMVSIWFAPAALVVIILDFLDLAPIWQVLIFLVISMIGILFVRRFLAKHIKAPYNKTNIDAIVGSKCIVTEKVDNYAGCGQARINGQIWSARGISDDDVFEVGEVLDIVAIEGVKLICKK